jgi:hypothetical protein
MNDLCEALRDSFVAFDADRYSIEQRVMHGWSINITQALLAIAFEVDRLASAMEAIALKHGER